MTLQEQKRAALAAYDAGTPSLLDDANLYKGAVEQHRWGQHEQPAYNCPVCQRALQPA